LSPIFCLNDSGLGQRVDSDWLASSSTSTRTTTADAKMRGYQLMTNGGNLPRPLSRQLCEAHPCARIVHEYKFSLHDVDRVFKPVTPFWSSPSTWFPLYDHDPQTFVPTSMTANPRTPNPQPSHLLDPEHRSTLQVPLVTPAITSSAFKLESAKLTQNVCARILCG